jgi:hypothetical protein
VGQAADGGYEATAACFAPNPVAAWGFFGGFGLGFVVGLPLCLISWPLTALAYPADEDAFRGAASVSPALGLGALTGTLLALPLFPFGIPFTPDEPLPETDGARPATDGAGEDEAAPPSSPR